VQRYLPVSAVDLQDNTEAKGESKSVLNCHQAMEVKSRCRQYRKLRPIHPQLRGAGEIVAELCGTMSLAHRYITPLGSRGWGKFYQLCAPAAAQGHQQGLQFLLSLHGKQNRWAK
jgi:hypothetical protein